MKVYRFWPQTITRDIIRLKYTILEYNWPFYKK